MSRVVFCYVLFALMSSYCTVLSAAAKEYTFVNGELSYPYSVVQTGDNYTFKFDHNPEDRTVKLSAGYHVLQSIYKDRSINKTYSESYIRERARCYVFDSRFHTYSLCFLPNDFNKKNTGRFWGFVTQMPNWKWLVSRFLLPVLCAYGIFFYVARRR